MASFNSQEKNLYNTIYSELKALGVKLPKQKKIKLNASKLEVFVSEKSCKIFGVNLREQEWVSSGTDPVPKFVALTTEYLQKFSHKEGLFRKGGNLVRQRKLKVAIEKEGNIEDSDPNDVAALLKQWLRELPEPLIPSHLQELFVRCHSLESEKDRETAYLLSFLLLPTDHQHTLKHLLHFFANIALDSDKNKMDAHNLAVILAPNIFALKETADRARNNLICHHTSIIQTLIEKSDKIGIMPPSFLYQSTSLLGSELNASVDVLDMGPGKYKKRMSGTVQDLFSGIKRLVGQNISTKATSVVDLAETAIPRPSFSLDNLDNNVFVTPENKGRTIPERSSSRHSRRKSFGAYFLRKKEKKRNKSDNQNLQMKVVDISLDPHIHEQKESSTIQERSTCQLNLNFTHSFPIDNKESTLVTTELSEQTTSRPVAPTRSDSITVVKKSESIKWFTENKAETMRIPKSVESKPPELTRKLDFASTHKSGLSRQEAFSIKAPKMVIQNTVPNITPENDLKCDTLNLKAKPDASPNNQSIACMHSQSACNLKCGKNKSVCEKKTHNKTKKEYINKRRPQSLKMPRHSEGSSKETSNPSRISSHQNLSENSSPPIKPISKLRDEVSASNVSQSLDLSLSLLLQNFCLSPPLDASEFRLSIDISSDKKNSELKVNISQKETPAEIEEKNLNGSSKNESSDSKPRKRLSSNSDSRIPRLKKIPNPNRPSSFHGTLPTLRRRDPKMEKSGKNFVRHSTKIPLLQIEENSASTSKVEKTYHQSPSDSWFKTPETSFIKDAACTSWIDGSHYLSALASPSDEIFNKRESIAKILKHNPGHVLSKVSMYDSKGSSGSESDYKLLRTSSEKYSSVSRCNRPKLTISNSYNAVGRSDSVRYVSTPQKQQRPIPRKVSFKTSGTPLSKRTVTVHTAQNAVNDGVSNNSSNTEQTRSGIKN